MKPWMNHELNFIRQNASKFSIKEMAALLGRPYDSVRYQAIKFGINIKRRQLHKPWTTQEIKTLLEMRAAGETYAVIGKALGRSKQTCRGAWVRNKDRR